MPAGQSPQPSFVQRILPFVEAGNPTIEQQTRSCLKLLARHLESSIAAELRSDRYVLLDWPNHSNIGDRVIHFGEMYLLDNCLGAQCVYSSDIESFEVNRLNQVAPEIPILLHGGGNLGDIWPRHQEFREAVIGGYPKRRIIILPQTMYFQDPVSLKRTSTVFAKHPNLTIFLRDQRSYQLARKHFGDERVRLAPDMAISLIDFMPELVRAMGTKPVRDLLCLFRADKESSENRLRAPEGAWTTDWPTIGTKNIEWPKLPAADALADTAGVIDLLSRSEVRKSWEYFVVGLNTILKAKRLMTDRLHGHILATLCAKPHMLLSNQYYKNRAFFLTWTAGLPQVEFKDLP